jgi:predicted amidophosphoribosyltransferase
MSTIFRAGDYGRKKEVVHKVKIPTQDKSNKVFCRNCNKQNTSIAKICSQCEITMSPKPMRKKMK